MPCLLILLVWMAYPTSDSLQKYGTYLTLSYCLSRTTNLSILGLFQVEASIIFCLALSSTCRCTLVLVLLFTLDCAYEVCEEGKLVGESKLEKFISRGSWEASYGKARIFPPKAGSRSCYQGGLRSVILTYENCQSVTSSEAHKIGHPALVETCSE